jgi:hypothetical protein
MMGNSNNSQEPPQIADLQAAFYAAQSQPGKQGLSPATTEILVQNLTPTVVQGAQGISSDELGEDRAMLIVPLLDMTGSMVNFRQDVVNAYNGMLTALQGSGQADQMLLSGWTFNTQSYLLHGYMPVEFVPTLDLKRYRPGDQTALYDAILDAITGMVAYGQALRNQGVRTRLTLVVFTDGLDNSSRRTAAQVRQVVEDLQAQEIYTFVLVTFGQGFAKKMAQDIGIINVMEADASGEDIKRSMEVVSRSLIKASQTVVLRKGQNAFFS